MTWSHRVYRHKGAYTIREHYEDTKGKCLGYSGPQEPIAFDIDGDQESPIEQLRWQLNMMLTALDKPILEDNDTRAIINVTQDEVLQAFGRAYCTPENSTKLVDFDLGSALCDELFGKDVDDSET